MQKQSRKKQNIFMVKLNFAFKYFPSRGVNPSIERSDLFQ